MVMKTAKCDWASEVVAAFVLEEMESSQSESNDVRRAVGHVAGCSRCQTDLLALMRITTGGDPTVDSAILRILRCPVTLEELASISEGRQPRSAAALHVESCSVCQDHVRFLRDVITEEDMAPEVAHVAAEPGFEGLWKRIGSATQRLSHAISVAMTSATAEFMGLPRVLESRSSTVVTPVRGRQPERIAGKLTIPIGVGTESISILVEPAAGGKATLVVSTASERGLPTGHYSLRAPEGELLERPAINEKGEAEFPRLRPGEYVLRFEAAADVWELLVKIESRKRSKR